MAIAFDAAASAKSAGAVTSLTYAHTCTGSQLLLIVGTTNNSGSDTVTGVTYNNIAMSKLKAETGGGFGVISLWYLFNPSTGANNVVVTSNASVKLGSAAASYTGAISLDTNTSNFANPGVGTDAATSLTSVIDNDWIVNFIGGATTTAPAAGTNLTSRSAQSGGSGQACGIGDSNTVIHPAGSSTLHWTVDNNTNWSTIQLAISPTGGLSVYRSLMGVGA